MCSRLAWTLVATAVLAACGGAEPEAVFKPVPAPPSSVPARGSASLELGDTRIVIDYGRPELKANGTVTGTGLPPAESRRLQATGFVWRLGRNAATKMTTSGHLRFGELRVPAGAYALFLRKKNADEWELLFNSAADQWGAFDYDASLDVGAAALQISETRESLPRFTIELARDDGNGVLRFRWGSDSLETAFVAE